MKLFSRESLARTLLPLVRYHNLVHARERIGRYLVSLPERLVRSASALAAGLVREIGEVALPASFRRSSVYQNMVESTLRFLIEQVGQAEGAYPPEGRLAENFALRRAAGDGIDLVGLLAFRASPVWVMAALADISGAGRLLIREIAGSLKEEGLLDANANFENVDQILDGLEGSAVQVAKSLRAPPLNVAELRKEWDVLRACARTIPAPNLPSPEFLWRSWEELKSEAAHEHRSVFQMSTLVALSTISHVPENMRWLSRCAQTAARRTGQLFAGTLLDHYSLTLKEIRSAGYLNYWIREFRPYLRAAAEQFSPQHRTLTERLWSKKGS